jgi:hypothetical protein
MLKDFRKQFRFILFKPIILISKYNTPLKKIKQSYISVEIKEMLLTNQNILESYRTDSLDIEAKKPISIDSIAVKRRIASRIRFGRKIINGFLPLVFLIWTYENHKL